MDCEHYSKFQVVQAPYMVDGIEVRRDRLGIPAPECTMCEQVQACLVRFRSDDIVDQYAAALRDIRGDGGN